MSCLRAALLWAILTLSGSTLLPGQIVFNIQEYDAACGQPQHNCRDAFQKAFKAAATAGGGVVQLPAGTFFVDFPEIANDTRPGRPLDRSLLLAVPPKVKVKGHSNTSGTPDSIIEWKVTSIPVFVFASASDSGMSNLHLRFTGTTPQNFPYGDIALLRSLGYQPTYPQLNQMSGGNYEMFSFALLFDSEHCVFDNLLFDSATHDNQHVMGFALNAKGKNVIVAGGTGGLSGDADGNRFSNIKLYDYVMGLLLSGQEDLDVENIVADRRGSTAKIAPGHVIYFTNTNLYSAAGKITIILSKSVKVNNVTEGPSTYSNEASLGTLAVKYIDGATFDNITSQHPAGLLQTLVSLEHVTFENLTWSTDTNACEGTDTAAACGVPVIESVVPKPDDPPMGNLKFIDIHLKSNRPITTNMTGKTIDIDGMTIETPAAFRKTKAQQAPYGVLGVKEASDVTVKNFTYIPVITSMDATEKYNQPFVCWGACSNVKADVTIKWPSSVPQPAKGHPAVTSGIQFEKPDGNNSISSRIQTR